MFSNLTKRVITSVVIILTIISFTLFFTEYLRFILSIVIFYGFWEWLKISGYGLNKNRIWLFVTFFLTIFFSIGLQKYGVANILLYFNVVIWLGTAFILLKFNEETNHFKSYSKVTVNRTILVSGYIILPSLYLSFLYLSQVNIEKSFLLFFVIAYVALSDIGGYFCGKLFGKKKIFPNISPNKTLEGYIGGFLISFTAILLTYEKFLNETLFTTVIIFTIFIILSFIGDLYISLIKRIHSLEDTGSILPGHGGLLDRIDSYLFSIPFIYLTLFIE